jgi:hypothetical protein
MTDKSGRKAIRSRNRQEGELVMPGMAAGSSRILRKCGTAVLIALVLASIPSAVLGWHQLRPPPGQDYVDCLNTSASPCIEWPKTAQNLSVNVDVYLSYTLSQANLDLKSDVRNAFPKWNQVAARNPHLQETASTADEEIWVTRTNIADDPTIAAFASIQNGPGPHYKISSVVIDFNSLVTWNRSYSFGCNGTQTSCWADSRYTAVHEFGHAEGLGHVLPSSPFASIMKAPVSTATQWWPAVNDHNGIIAIYGAYP